MGGFRLQDIDHEKIVMVRGEESITIPMLDPSHPRWKKEAGEPAAQPSAAAPLQQRPAAAQQQREKRQAVIQQRQAAREQRKQSRAPQPPQSGD
jgi:hypothetical protein